MNPHKFIIGVKEAAVYANLQPCKLLFYATSSGVRFLRIQPPLPMKIKGTGLKVCAFLFSIFNTAILGIKYHDPSIQ